MTRVKFLVLVGLFFTPLVISDVDGHTVDAIAEKYRIEIGWMNEPVVSGETNGIELLISHLTPCPDISEAMKCAESQEFENGIGDLEKDLKLQLAYKTEKITLSLKPDHNIVGKYYAYVNPTVAGFYQANLLGEIQETVVSLSMHPPKVDEREYIEFPEKAGKTVEQIIEAHTSIIEELGMIKNEIDQLKESTQVNDVSYVGIGLGIAGIVIASIAMAKTKR